MTNLYGFKERNTEKVIYLGTALNIFENLVASKKFKKFHTGQPIKLKKDKRHNSYIFRSRADMSLCEITTEQLKDIGDFELSCILFDMGSTLEAITL